MKRMDITVAQINPTVGAIDANIELIRAARKHAARIKSDLVVTPELAVSGYPPEDLVLSKPFMTNVMDAVRALAAETKDGGPALLLGSPWIVDGEVRNAAILLDGGEIVEVRSKIRLPNYGVFDEARFFKPGKQQDPMNFRGLRLGVMICEDMWYSEVAAHLANKGADLLIVLNGSPFEIGKPARRVGQARGRSEETSLPLLYVNLVGGQDELVFDGGSFVLNGEAKLSGRLPMWKTDSMTIGFVQGEDGWECEPSAAAEPTGRWGSIYQAMMLGLHDYVNKNGFPGVVLGLSGGVDSALTAAVAVDALGPERVVCIMMPSPYTSKESLQDAAAVGKLLGTGLETIPILPAMQAFEKMLGPVLAGSAPDTTEENIQARARGVTLMALSNKLGFMVLSTGNKSEMSVGYATLYGDMCGGYSVLKDVYKTTVFQLSKWRNTFKPEGALGPDGPVMPNRVITKPPSAELRPNQKDEDSLPPYVVLDAILQGLIEEEASVKDLTAKGHKEADVQRVWRMINTAEYKRRQAPPGVKITTRAFGRDRRYPITDAFKVLK